MCMKRAVCCEGHSSAFFLPFGWVSLPVKTTLEQPARLRWMWIEPMMEISRHTCWPICWLFIYFYFFTINQLVMCPGNDGKCTLQYPRLQCDISNSLNDQWSVSIITVFFCEGILTEWEEPGWFCTLQNQPGSFTGINQKKEARLHNWNSKKGSNIWYINFLSLGWLLK